MSPVLVKHLMSSPVVSLFAEQTLPLVEDIMRFKHIRHLPVVEGHTAVAQHRVEHPEQVEVEAGYIHKGDSYHD